MKKVILSLLCFITATASCLMMYACRNQQKNEDGVVYSYKVITDTSYHSFTIKNTEEYIVKDGKTDYKIVYPSTSNTYENIAVEEFVLLFEEATNITLSTIKDSEITYSDSSKLISIGNTSILSAANVKVDYKRLGVNGLGIYTKDKSVFLVGGSEYGIVYAVYELLSQMFNFDVFFADCYYIDTLVEDLKLMDYNITDIPDIKKCVANIGYLVENTQLSRRMRAPYRLNSVRTGISGRHTHNTLWYLPKNDEHLDWISDTETQLCYTAHGNNEERALMVQAFADRLKATIMANPDKSIFGCSNMDTNDWCGCDACRAEAERYGVNSAVYIKFFNEVYDIVHDWMLNDETGKQYYTPDFRIALLAYQQCVEAPVKYNSKTNKYEAIDDSVKMRDGVIVEYAPIDADFTMSLADSSNITFKSIFNGWSAISKEVAVWSYSTNFRYQLLPYDTFNSMQDNYKFYNSMHSLWIFDQSQYTNNGGATAWHTLKTYLNTKLAWNVNANINSYIDRFFKYYYGEASTAMKNYFENYRIYAAYQEKELGYCKGNTSIYFAALNKVYWPKHLIDSWNNYIYEALSSIEYLKEINITKYNMYYRNIVQERICNNYLLIELYSAYFNADALLKLKQQFIDDATLCGLTQINEVGSMSDYINSLGI